MSGRSAIKRDESGYPPETEKDCWVSWEDGDCLINFSAELLERLGWKTGDVLELEGGEGFLRLNKEKEG